MLKAAVVALALIAGGCGSSPPLEDTAPSARELAQEMLDSLEARDAERLRRLALSEQEFREHVWPALPAARPERNLPFSYVWGDLRQKSESSLRGVIARHGGRHYELLDVRFDGDTGYGPYRVHRDATLRVRESSGAEIDLRVSGSLIEKDGSWKVFSYLTDE